MNSQHEMSPTFRLFGLPTLLDGIGSAFDLGGVYFLYNGSRSPQEADRLAIFADVRAVGMDFEAALEQAATAHEGSESPGCETRCAP